MMSADEDEDRLARLALALRVTRNHPRAFEDLDKDIEQLATKTELEDKTALMHRVASLVARSG